MYSILAHFTHFNERGIFMMETLKKLAGKALPWTFWGTIACSVIAILVGVYYLLGGLQLAEEFSKIGFYARQDLSDFMSGSETSFVLWFLGLLLGLFTLLWGFITRKFTLPIIGLLFSALSFVCVFSFSIVPNFKASAIEQDLLRQTGYREAREVDELVSISNRTLKFLMMDLGTRKPPFSQSEARQIQSDIDEVSQFNRETVRMICAQTNGSEINSRVDQASLRALEISKFLKNVRDRAQNSASGGGYSDDSYQDDGYQDDDF